MSKSAKGTQESPGKNVKAKSGLNRGILDQGWSLFNSMLDYKLEELGGRLIKVCPRLHKSEMSLLPLPRQRKQRKSVAIHM